jgi:hypothetical protein
MMSSSDRHRMLLATIVTVVALPTLWIASRSDSSAAPRLAAAGAPSPAANGLSDPATSADTDTNIDTGTGTGTNIDTDTSASATDGSSASTGSSSVIPGMPGSSNGEPAAPAYLEGPTSSAVTATAPIASPSTNVGLRGTARYERFSSYYPNRACRVPAAPMWAVVTVHNLDTDRTTSCLNSSISPTGQSDIATVDIDVFLEIADLADAPLPVELTW